VRSVASKAYAAFQEGRLSRSPLDWLRLVRLHYRELAEQRASARPALPPRSDVGSSESFKIIDRSILAETIAAGGRLQFAEMHLPLVSVLIAVHNKAELTLRCLRSLACTRIPIEVVIVDNGSTDETTALLALIDGAVVIRNAENIGFLCAVNQAAALARGKLLLLLNNDTDVLPGSLESAVETLLTSRNAGAVVGKLVHQDGRLQEAGSIVWRDGSCEGYGRGDDPLAPPYMFRRDVDFGSAAFLLTPRATFLEAGGFDRRYQPAYYEDVDYSVRLWKAGQRVIYDPRAVVVHAEFASASSSADAIALQAEHRTLFVERHRDWLESRTRTIDRSVLQARAQLGQGQRVLLIDDRVPHERLGSGSPRALAIVRAALELGHHITVYPLTVSEERWDEAYSDVPRDVEVYTGSGPAGLAQFLDDRYSYYEAIIVSRPHNMRIVRDALPSEPREKRPALIYDAEALFALREIGRRQFTGRPVTDEQHARMIAKELSLASGCDLVLTVSPAEGQRFLDAGFTRVTVLGNSLTPQPTERSFEDRRDFLFVGAIGDDEAPNADSIVWMVREVLPRIQARMGTNVRMVVAGRNASPRVAALCDASVDMVGMVRDVRPLFDQARVFIAPSRFGAGIPTKVQQAAAFGVPVVCTSLVSRQLGWSDGVDLLVGDNADAFAGQCCALYSDSGIWRRLRESALAKVTRECSPRDFRSTLEAALLEAQKVQLAYRPPPSRPIA